MSIVTTMADVVSSCDHPACKSSPSVTLDDVCNQQISDRKRPTSPRVTQSFLRSVHGRVETIAILSAHIQNNLEVHRQVYERTEPLDDLCMFLFIRFIRRTTKLSSQRFLTLTLTDKKYALSFSRNFSFLRGCFYAAP